MAIKDFELPPSYSELFLSLSGSVPGQTKSIHQMILKETTFGADNTLNVQESGENVGRQNTFTRREIVIGDSDSDRNITADRNRRRLRRDNSTRNDSIDKNCIRLLKTITFFLCLYSLPIYLMSIPFTFCIVSIILFLCIIVGYDLLKGSSKSNRTVGGIAYACVCVIDTIAYVAYPLICLGICGAF